MIVAATHDGSFHADDALAAAILAIAVPGIHIIRTRDPERLAACDLRFDVGGTFDPEEMSFDHHMREPPTRGCGTPYSSAGLIWREFGRIALRSRGFGALAEAKLERAWAAIDNGIVTSVDKIDNGIVPPGPTDVATLIDLLNPPWTEARTPEGMDALFARAQSIASALLEGAIAAELGAARAEAVVLEAASRREDPRILVLDGYAPFKKAVMRNGLDDVLYAVLPSGSQGDWGVSAMSVTPDSFVNRKDMPTTWGGLTDGDLQAATGVPDAVFAHRNLFFAVARSKAGALRLAKIAAEA